MEYNTHLSDVPVPCLRIVCFPCPPVPGLGQDLGKAMGLSTRRTGGVEAIEVQQYEPT